MARFVGRSMTKGAVRPKHLRAATKVWFFQCPNGALERSPGALWASSAQPCHLRGRAGVIDEDEAVWLKLHPGLTPGHPLLASFGDVGPILLAGQQLFF